MLFTLIAAGGLISIPILIHIFNRTRYRKIEWAAMEFLLAAYRRTRRRMQLEHLLLLLLRILAMLFLAFAFFPQGVSGATDSVLDTLDISLAQTSDTGRAQHLICLVDDSASMRYLSGEGTRIEAYTKASEHARRYIGALNKNRDKVSLIFPASLAFQAMKVEEGDEEAGAVTIRELSAENALEALQSHKVTYGRAELLSAFKLVAAKVAGIAASDVTPRVVVISDFQANEWDFANQDSPEYQAFTNVLDEINASLSKRESNMVFVNALSSDPSPRVNVGITDVELKSRIVGVGMPVTISTKVTFSSSDASAGEYLAHLEYQIDGENIRPFDAPTRVPVGETISVEQRIPPFSTAGAHRVKVRIAKLGDDRFADDNQAYLAINARTDVPILIINGAPKNNENDKDEVDDLSLALEIASSEDEEGNALQRFTPNKVTVVLPSTLNVSHIKQASVIYLANVSELPPTMLKALEDRVFTGGASVIFTLGNRIDIGKFNAAFWKEGKGLAPAKLVRERAYNENEATLDLMRLQINDLGPNSLLSEVKAPEALVEAPGISRWIETILPQDAPESKGVTPDAHTIMSVVVEPKPEPLLISRPFGGAITAMWTTSIDADWNTLWVGYMPIFIIIHEVTSSLSGVDSRRRHLNIGERIVQDLPLHPSGYTMVAPVDGAIPTTQTEVDKTTVRVIFDETFTPGIYNLKPADDDTIAATSHYYSVLMPAEESNMAVLGNDPDTVRSIASVMTKLTEKYPALDFEMKELTSSQIAGSVGDRGMDRWLLFLGLALLCLLAETALTLITGRRKEA